MQNSHSLRVGFFLATRQIRRANIWTTILIILIMMLTFLNLVVVSGILVGLIEGSSNAYRAQYSADVLVKNLPKKNFIPESSRIIRTALSYPEVIGVTGRLIEGGTLEANYKTKTRLSDLPEAVGAQITGINPYVEDEVTHLSKYVIEGSYLRPDEEGQVLIGSELLSQYNRAPANVFDILTGVTVGSQVRVTINGVVKEVRVKGIVKSKISSVSRRVFFVDRELRQIVNQSSLDVDEIAIKLRPGVDPMIVESSLASEGFIANATIQTWDESQGQFYKDIGTTFDMLGNFIGSIGVVVASITIFIIIFINAVTRRKFIGILKGIGITNRTIEISYVLQSVFYAIIGSLIGLALLYGVLKPYFDVHPIDFPFSDGILVAPFDGTMIRVLILFVATLIAGFVPARLIVRKNTLDAILGR